MCKTIADAVVSTLVLCSVTSLSQSVKLIADWLKPGGKLLFLEHVAHKPGTYGRSFQKSIQGPWAWIGDGCDLVRDTHDVLATEGKLEVQLLGDMRENYTLGMKRYMKLTNTNAPTVICGTLKSWMC